MHTLLESPWDDLTHPVVLIVEDSDEDFYTFLRASRNLEDLTQIPYPFLRFQDGDEALDYLLRQGAYENLKAPLPRFLLLDLNLPGTDGRDIIHQIKHNPRLEILPIIVLTTSNSPRDIETCYHYGANSYLLKPMGIKAMQETLHTLFQYWFHVNVLPIHDKFSF